MIEIFRSELSHFNQITIVSNDAQSRGNHMKQKDKLDRTMFKIKLEGQEGYFLTENEYKQLKNFFNAYEGKVIQNANNS